MDEDLFDGVRYHLQECGRCSAIWSPGSEEFEEQRCGACGWELGDDPVSDDDDDHDFTEYLEDYGFPDDDEKTIDEANDGVNL